MYQGGGKYSAVSAAAAVNRKFVIWWVDMCDVPGSFGVNPCNTTIFVVWFLFVSWLLLADVDVYLLLLADVDVYLLLLADVDVFLFMLADVDVCLSFLIRCVFVHAGRR